MDRLIDYAMQHVGLPYRWGGDDPMRGYDCSGFVQEILASVGEDPAGDQTADSLYRHFSRYGKLQQPDAGALAFFGSGTKITHVTFCIDNFRMIEAGGGGSKVKTVEDAARQNAYIRVRPISLRSDLVETIMPDYDFLRSVR